MSELNLRINLDNAGKIGSTSVELLEQIATVGSISAAARRMDMSYKHAWDKVDGLNKALGKPLVLAQTGGRRGGGATLTAAGQAVISHFRAIEQAATAVADQHMAALRAELHTA